MNTKEKVSHTPEVEWDESKGNWIAAPQDSNGYVEARFRTREMDEAVELVRRWKTQPELLEACKGFVQMALNAYDEFEIKSPTFIAAQAAIAKAEPKS